MKKLIICLLILSSFYQIYSQTIVSKRNKLIELEFLSDKFYNHPVKDIDLTCTLFSSSGENYSVGGFWKGDNKYAVRFSLPETGNYNYLISCSDTTNEKLNNISGTITISGDDANNDFYSKGFPKVSTSGKYLVFGDGDPLFYMADIAYHITYKSKPMEVKSYISDRKGKGFNSVHVMVLSQDNISPRTMNNMAGDSLVLNRDLSLPNPKYFDYLDYIIQTANDSGMIVMLFPLWGGLSEVTYDNSSFPEYFTQEESILWAKYIAARYSGYNIIWAGGGNVNLDTELKKNFWAEFCKVLKTQSGGKQLVTLHPAPLKTTTDFYGNEAAWLDFNMYNLSISRQDEEIPWDVPKRCLDAVPGKPLLACESCYEYLGSYYFGYPHYDPHFETMTNNIHVRRSHIQNVLSGSYVGFVYGADGVWQWRRKEDSFSGYFSKSFDSSITYDASGQLRLFKDFFITYKYYLFTPTRGLVRSKGLTYTPLAKTDSEIISFISLEVESATYDLNSLKTIRNLTLLNSLSGRDQSTHVNISANMITISPIDCDFLVRINSFDEVNEIENNESIPDAYKLFQNYPNPFNPSTTIKYSVPIKCFVNLIVYDLLGRKIETLVNKLQNSGEYEVNFKPDNLPSGVYYLRLSAGEAAKNIKMVYVR